MVPLRQQVTESSKQETSDLITPRKLPNPILVLTNTEPFTESCYYATEGNQSSHPLVSEKAKMNGLLLRQKPELQCVLEHRQREQYKEKEAGLCPPSDLEVKLRIRLQKIQVYELDEKKKSESLQNVPEFVRVRGTLKRIQTFS